jgi:hypothetical protein
MRSLDDDRRVAPPLAGEARQRARTGSRRLRIPWGWARGRGRLASAAGSPQVGALARYLGDLEEWSHRVWMAAGVRRPWLPEALRRQVVAAWGVADGADGDRSRGAGDGRNEGDAPDPAEHLRGRIATFWAEVLPWMAWNPEAEELPDPPPDPRLTEAMVARLEREIERLGRPVMGAERSAVLRHGIQRLRLLAALRDGGGVLRAH